MITSKRNAIILIGSLSFVGSFSQSSSFTGLGDFPGGTFSSEAHSVSADGSTVAGYGTTAKGSQAFIWTESSGMVSLGNVADSSFKATYASKISADGKTIVGDGDSTASSLYEDRQGFMWTDTGGMKKFGSLNSSVRYRTSAVSSDGSVIAGYGGSEAFYWTKSNGIKGLGVLDGKTGSEVVALSADGSIAVGSSYTASCVAQEAFRWTENEGMIGLGYLPGHTYSFCNSISPDGSVVGGTSYLSPSSNAYAFRWTEEKGMEDIGSLPEKTTMHPCGLSTNGAIIVGVGYDDSYNMQAFIWDSIHGIRNLKTVLQNEYGLNLNGWNLSVAYAITPDGKVIVGFGENPSGNQEAFRVILGSPVNAIKTITRNKAGFEIYPNPTTVQFTISFDTEVQQANVEITNLQGKVVFSKTFQSITSATIDLTGFSKGYYLVKVIIDDVIYYEKVCLE